MPESLPPDTAPRHRLFCLLLCLITLSQVTGRILTVVSPTGESPMLSANDRSRWCTIRALVDQGTYAIDDVIDDKHNKTKRAYWQTIDRVRHRGADGQDHVYSSKPTLFPTLLAAQYWVIQQATGARLETHSFYVMRLLLIMTNVGMLAVYFWVLYRWLDRWGDGTWSPSLAMVMACFGTFLTSFAITLNNHLPAAVSCLVAVFAVISIWEGKQGYGWYLLAGLGAGFAAANELPALSLVVALAIACLMCSPTRTFLGYVPGVLLVAAAFFGTNYLAHGSWRPPYMHRQDGRLVAQLPLSLAPASPTAEMDDPLRKHLQEIEPLGVDETVAFQLMPALPDSTATGQTLPRWVVWDETNQRRWALVTTAEHLELREWDNWYEYDDTYWREDRKQGVDRGEASRALYAFHVVAGHHGILSLTPFWIVSAIGVVLWLAAPRPSQRGFAWLVFGLTFVCLAFYLSRPQEDRNYGGMTSGFRWMFWFIPLWIVASLPALQRMSAQRWSRSLVYAAAVISVLSASYASLNPWVSPWIEAYLDYLK